LRSFIRTLAAHHDSLAVFPERKLLQQPRRADIRPMPGLPEESNTCPVLDLEIPEYQRIDALSPSVSELEHPKMSMAGEFQRAIS